MPGGMGGMGGGMPGGGMPGGMGGGMGGGMPGMPDLGGLLSDPELMQAFQVRPSDYSVHTLTSHEILI